MVTVIPGIAIAFWLLVESPWPVRKALARPSPFLVSTLLAVATGLLSPGSLESRHGGMGSTTGRRYGDESEWVIKEGAWEAIISKETADKVGALMNPNIKRGITESCV